MLLVVEEYHWDVLRPVVRECMETQSFGFFDQQIG